ncbi:hypothetical protein TIFTF001_035131 [Ficus carica]|uniref:Uncharacterized protein n=1 Tax=Ficus carica TaxID=3494 RepID=A0AA88E483_FICCA|nr:hypothetical protein TIFTF001_035126 [Ficus carica]GMN66064.1 hypothetical protein TIFTF001_035131 [Ficus carica]
MLTSCFQKGRKFTTTKSTLHDGDYTTVLWNRRVISLAEPLYTTVPKNRRVKCLAEQLYTTVPKNRRVISLAEQLYTTVPMNRRVKCLAEQLYTTVPMNRRIYRAAAKNITDTCEHTSPPLRNQHSRILNICRVLGNGSKMDVG